MDIAYKNDIANDNHTDPGDRKTTGERAIYESASQAVTPYTRAEAHPVDRGTARIRNDHGKIKRASRAREDVLGTRMRELGETN